MPLPSPEVGLVISYSYLWKSDADRGHDEGTKNRPCAIILMTKDNEGDTLVTVVPITHSQPKNADDGIEIPQQTKKRLGLDEARSWIMISELNRFVWPGPDLRPISRDEPERFAYGVLPPKLFWLLRDKLIINAKKSRVKTVERD